MEQFNKFFRWEGECEIILILVNFKHDTKKRDSFFNNVFSGEIFLEIWNVLISVIDLMIRVDNLSCGYNFNLIGQIWVYHSIKSVVILFETLYQRIFYYVLDYLQKFAEFLLWDDSTLVILW